MTRSRGRRGRGPVIQGEAVGRNQGPAIVRGVGAYSIGDVSGETTEPVDVTFTYFGKEIRVNPDMTEVDIIDFLEQAEQVNANDPKSMIMVKDTIRSHIHPDDFEAFWQLRKANRQGVQQLMATIWQIIAGVTGKATGQRSDSSDGRPVTSQNLPATSSSTDTGPSDLRGRYLAQIARFESQGTANGVAMAAQMAAAAEARGIVLDETEASYARTA